MGLQVCRKSCFRLCSSILTQIKTQDSRFLGRWADDEDEEEIKPIQPKPRPSGGVAIAPPPSLQEPPESSPLFPSKPQPSSGNFGSSVAAKIMAKYGFKEGQGLGKQEQGMSIALQVEKTSKRGGRIIHEKELLAANTALVPPIEDSPPPEPSITDIIKNPSKVEFLLFFKNYCYYLFF